MKVYSLVGKSGTGKSYQAVNLCREMNIESIIDDGLFISSNDVLAGISAKRQATRIGAIKTALFTADEHRDEVVEKIKEVDPASILVIGTSVEMVERIRKRLELPEIEKTILIEDITTEKERAEAAKQRNELGKHVIPAPTFALKRDFSGYFVDPLKIIRTWGRKRGGTDEKSVVRPTYSYMGDYSISDRVIDDIVRSVSARDINIADVVRTDTKKVEHGIALNIIIYLRKGRRIFDAAESFQKSVCEKLEYMTAFNVEKVDVEIRGLR